MSFQWHEFIDLATLLASEDSECHRRCAISRAYYATYHAGRRRWAQEQGHPTDRRIEHAPLWEYFRQQRARSRVGENGRRLLQLHRSADYDASPECSVKTTQYALNLARELLATLAEP